jgi:trehalose/maltose hydrolase-like predicted phosphorylase
MTDDDALCPGRDPDWLLHADGYDALRETTIESRFAISNGFLGLRATRAITRGASWAPPPRTYVAGLFGTPGTEPAAPTLIPAADWLQIRVMLPSGPIVHHPGDVTVHRMTLDMKNGVLVGESRGLKALGAGTSEITAAARTFRLVSLDDRAIGLQLLQFDIEKGQSEITLEALFEGLELGLVAERLELDLGLWRAHGTGKRLAIATASMLHVDGTEMPPTSRRPLSNTWTWACHSGQSVRFQRIVAIARADMPDQDPGRDAQDKLDNARRRGAGRMVAEHKAAWSERWRCGAVEVVGDPDAQRALRFAIYHLIGAANPADERVSIGARALTGADYHGHVFWDTEIYLLPFYTMTWPEAARSLLMYRWRTLDGARAKAAGMGWRGALYAWESADTGAETTPEQVIGPDRKVVEVLNGKQEQHISADVAYAVWHYWKASGDEAFLCDAGAEIILETGRFWSSRAELGQDGKRHIRGVIGPDEYHMHIDDNAFTNVMARWNIRRAVEVAALLASRWPARWASLSAALDLDDNELSHWSDVADTIADGFDCSTGLFEQFAGYDRLENIDLSNYPGRSVPMDVILGRDRIQGSQLVKQADVVALLGLLPEAFPADTAAKNFRHYAPRCSHGSSLSRAMHGLVAARLGMTDIALDYLRQTSAIDLGDTQVAIDGGIHIAALGGIWLIAVAGFAGLSLTEDGLALKPQLPAAWKSLGFTCQWRGRSVSLRIGQAGVDATLQTGAPMTLLIGEQKHTLHTGQALHISSRPE